MRYRLRSLFIAVTLCALVTAAGVVAYRAAMLFRGVSGQAVSAQAANRVLRPPMLLPDSASDVTYYCDFGAAEAEFAIVENEFLQWCEAKNWPVKEITSPVVYFQPLFLDGDPRMVERGYHFHPPDGEGTFDADRGRACFRTSTFP